MERKEINASERYKLMEFIMTSLLKRGMKATTMDYIAESLKMSKRTLYEIFGSKEEMFSDTLEYFHNKLRENLIKIWNTSHNVMEGIVKCFLFNRDLMSNVNVEFVRDLQQYIARHKKNNSESRHHEHYLNLYEAIQKGVDEGYFRDDLNLLVQCRMLSIQMESLKRMEELFPEDITLLEAYDTIILSFLRSICTEKGNHELEKIIRQSPGKTGNIIDLK